MIHINRIKNLFKERYYYDVETLFSFLRKTKYYRDEQKLKAYIATQEQAIFDQYKDEEAAVCAALKHAQDEQ